MTITPMPTVPPAGTTTAPAGAGSGKGGSDDFGSLLAQLAAPADPGLTKAMAEESTGDAEEQAAGADGVLALLTAVVAGAPATPAQGGLADAAVRGAAAPGGPGPGVSASVDAAVAGPGLATSGATSVLPTQTADVAGQPQPAGTATTSSTTEPVTEVAAGTQVDGMDADLLTTTTSPGGEAGDSAGQQTAGQQTAGQQTAGQQTQPGAATTLSAATGATAASATGGAAPSAAPTGVTASPLLDQVTPVVTRMVSAGEGSHRMVLRLHPADLGEVQLTVTVRGESVDVTVAAGTEARELLAGGSSELRSLLDSIGRTAGQITFRELPGAGQLQQPSPGVTTGDQPDAGQPGTSYGEPAGDRDGDARGRSGTARTGAEGSRDHGSEPERGPSTRPSGTPGSGALDVRI